MGQQGVPPQNCAYSSRHNENVIDTCPIPALVALTQKSEIPRKSKGETRVDRQLPGHRAGLADKPLRKNSPKKEKACRGRRCGRLQT